MRCTGHQGGFSIPLPAIVRFRIGVDGRGVIPDDGPVTALGCGGSGTPVSVARVDFLKTEPTTKERTHNMKSRTSGKTALLTLALLAGLTTATGLAATEEQAASPGASDYTRTVARPYADVLAAVKEAAQAQGFRVSNVHDIAASLRKDGIERPPYATVEVCNSKLAAQVLQAEPRLGAVMPCRIAVYQQGQGTVVTMIQPSRLMTFFPPKPEVAAAAAQVDRAMKAAIDAATR